MTCINSVSVSPKYMTLKVDDWTYAAYATVCPSNADCKTLFWYSSNPSVASVNAASGAIYANSIGTATIYATATDGSGCSDYLTVTVSGTISVASVTLDRASASMELCKTLNLSATVCPENASNKNLSWTSSNRNVATVYNGTVTAVGTGSTVITAAATDGSGKSASCHVTVSGDVLATTVTVIPSSLNMTVGNSAFLSASILPENATNCGVMWYSDDPCVATVNPNSGLVYAQNPGTTIIRAMAQDGSGAEGHGSVTVLPSVTVESIRICPETLLLNIGECAQLSAEVFPSNANASICWVSDNCDIADVGYYSGQVTAKSIGSVYIRAYEENNGAICTCAYVQVTNEKAVTVISCSPDAWVNSSEIMGADMANAANVSESYCVLCPENGDEFSNVWDSVNKYLIIHTHGSSNSLSNHAENGTPRIISLDEIKELNSNKNIDFVMMTACSTASGDQDNNVAYWLSKKINPNGIVIANKYTVSGGSDTFVGISDNNGNKEQLDGWVVYRNGKIEQLPKVLTMAKGHEIYKLFTTK